MARTIAVSDEVYEMLKKLKLPEESFSDVIKRLIKRGGRLSDIAGSGTITKRGWEELKKLRLRRKKFEEERKRMLLEFFGE